MIYDFISSALPYVAIGFMVAVVAAHNFKKEPAESEKPQKKGLPASAGYFTAAALLYLTAALHYFGSHSASSPTTFLCLGSLFVCLGAVAINKENKEKEEKENETKNDNETK